MTTGRTSAWSGLAITVLLSKVTWASRSSAALGGSCDYENFREHYGACCCDSGSIPACRARAIAQSVSIYEALRAGLEAMDQAWGKLNLTERGSRVPQFQMDSWANGICVMTRTAENLVENVELAGV